MRATAILILLALAACRDEDHKHYDMHPERAPRASSGLSEPERMQQQFEGVQTMGSPAQAPPDASAAPPAGGSTTPTAPVEETTAPAASPGATPP